MILADPGRDLRAVLDSLHLTRVGTCGSLDRRRRVNAFAGRSPRGESPGVSRRGL
jgi:hypothetical protein